MDIINHLQAVKQELRDESDAGTDKKKEKKIRNVVSRIDLLIKALVSLENDETDPCWAQVGEDWCPNEAVQGSKYCEEHQYLEDNE